MKNKLKPLLPIIVVVCFGIIAGLSLVHKGLPPTHDGEYHIVRFYLFNEAISDGNLYPRWAAHLNNNFGVPLFTFVYPFPNYVAAFFHLLGLSFIDSLKLEMFIGIIMGAIFFYLWACEFWGKLGGIVSSIFYTFSPYHFVDVYIRGSVGEVWALAFFPAFLWTYTKFAKSKQKIFFIYSSLCLALIIFSHNILALMFFFFCLSYMGLLIYGEKSRKYLTLTSLYIIFLGLGVSSIFWLPAIYETKYVTGLQIFDVTSHFPDLHQLLIPSWGSGFSGAGLQNELSYQIGIANLFAVFLSIIVIFFQTRRKDKGVFYTFFFLIWFIFILFLMLDISRPLWQIIPFMSYLQFPWRLLSIEILLGSFLAGSIFSLGIKNKWARTFLVMFLVFFVFIMGVGYSKPAYYLYRSDSYYITRSSFIDGTNSPGNVFNTIFLKTIPNKQKRRVEFVKGGGEIILDKSKSSQHIFRINAHKNSEILVNLPYYPGWEVYVNNKKTEIKQTQNGLFTFSLSQGSNKIEVVFKDNSVRKLAAFISFSSIIFISTLFMGKRFVTINK